MFYLSVFNSSANKPILNSFPLSLVYADLSSPKTNKIQIKGYDTPAVNVSTIGASE